MVKRRRSGASRPGGRRMKRARRYMPRRRMGKSLRRTIVHSFRRGGVTGTLTGNVAYAPYLGNYNTNFGQIINSGDFTALYDQYRINFIVVKFYLKIDPSAQTAATASFPRIFWYRDYDDNGNPASLNEIRENSKGKQAILHPNRPVTIKFKPNVLNTVYSSLGVSNYVPVFKQFLDMSTTATTHYGFKYAIDDLTNTNYKLDIETVVYFQCRQPR